MRLLLGWAICLLSSALFAANYFYCPQSGSYVYLGDSLTHVKQICGAPTSTAETKAPTQKTKTIIRWVYNYQPHAAVRSEFIVGKPNMKKNALVVDFDQDRAINIQVEGQMAQQTNYCRPDMAFKIGGSKQFLYQSCRQPTLKQTIVQHVPGPAQKQTVLTYQNGNYAMPTQLIFQKGKLVSIK